MLALAGVLAAGVLPAQEQKARLRVGTKVAAPFAFETADGRWQGITIEPWRRIAKRMGRDFESSSCRSRSCCPGSRVARSTSSPRR